MFQLQIRGYPVATSSPRLDLLTGIVHPNVISAMMESSRRMTAAGVRHALAGALAVGAYGYARNSNDVDFVVGDEAFVLHAGGVLTVNPQVPIRVGNVHVDPLPIGAGDAHLVEAMGRSTLSEGIPVLPVEALIYMKLKAGRSKDKGDVVELLKAGADPVLLMDYIVRNAPDLLPKLKALIVEAASEGTP